jgi:hypothetical protein
LLEDIRARKIDVIVVYKVDRLTRSLADFAKLVELFDAHGVSFVSVTQQFNTTTSMGRLTLNVLLSFAQFEREVTSERIRDKIAASKRKGLWVGGNLPLGYEMKDGKIAVVAPKPSAKAGRAARELRLGKPRNKITDLSILIFSTPSEIPTGSGTISAQITESSQWHLRHAGRARRPACSHLQWKVSTHDVGFCSMIGHSLAMSAVPKKCQERTLMLSLDDLIGAAE